MFDPQQFLDTPVTDANSTSIQPVPEGEFVAIIEKAEVRAWQGKKDPTQAGLALDVIFNIDDANLKQQLDREKISVKYGIMLDLSPTGGLDMGKGKNVKLGRLREAVGLNKPGQPFKMTDLVGCMAKIAVTQRIDGEEVYNDVKAVTKA